MSGWRRWGIRKEKKTVEKFEQFPVLGGRGGGHIAEKNFLSSSLTSGRKGTSGTEGQKKRLTEGKPSQGGGEKGAGWGELKLQEGEGALHLNGTRLPPRKNSFLTIRRSLHESKERK